MRVRKFYKDPAFVKNDVSTHGRSVSGMNVTVDLRFVFGGGLTKRSTRPLESEVSEQTSDTFVLTREVVLLASACNVKETKRLSGRRSKKCRVFRLETDLP